MGDGTAAHSPCHEIAAGFGHATAQCSIFVLNMDGKIFTSFAKSTLMSLHRKKKLKCITNLDYLIHSARLKALAALQVQVQSINHSKFCHCFLYLSFLCHFFIH